MGLEKDNHAVAMMIRKVTMKYEERDYLRETRLAREAKLRKLRTATVDSKERGAPP
jgi:hypothetical protein